MQTTDKPIQFLQAYQKDSDALFRYCYYKVFDVARAEDLTQQAFAKAWSHYYKNNVSNQEPITIVAYRYARALIETSRNNKFFFNIMKKLTKKFFWRRNRSRGLGSVSRDTLVEVNEVMHGVQENYRDAVILHYINDLSSQDISSILQEPQSSIDMKIQGGYKNMQEAI